MTTTNLCDHLPGDRVVERRVRLEGVLSELGCDRIKQTVDGLGANDIRTIPVDRRHLETHSTHLHSTLIDDPRCERKQRIS